MSVQKKLTERAEYRAAVERTRDDFAAFADEFMTDVERKRDISEAVDGFAETRTRFADAQASFSAYSEAFAADVARKRDIGDLAESIAAFHEACRRTRNELTEYTERFRADVAARRADRTAALDAFDSYVVSFYGDRVRVGTESVADSTDSQPETAGPTGTGKTEPAVDADGADGETVTVEADSQRATGADTSASDWATDRAETDGDAVGSEPMEGDDESAEEIEPETADDTGVDQSESVDEVSQVQDDADDDADFREELSDIPYGTLTKAANAMDYEGDLNSATKEDLIDFFSGKEMSELEAALEE